MSPVLLIAYLLIALLLLWEIILALNTYGKFPVAKRLFVVIALQIADPILTFGTAWLFGSGGFPEAALPYGVFVMYSEVILFAVGLLLCLKAWADLKERKGNSHTPSEPIR